MRDEELASIFTYSISIIEAWNTHSNLRLSLGNVIENIFISDFLSFFFYNSEQINTQEEKYVM